MKNVLCGAVGVIGSFLVSLFGGWSAGLATLMIFMAIDFISGLIVAGVFHNSPKTENGALESNRCWKGLFRKVMTLVFVIIGYRLDVTLGVDYVKNAVIFAFMANELISITENAGLMGLPIPKVIMNSIEVLKNKGDSNESKNQ